MQQTMPDEGPLDAWFMVAEQILRCGDRWLLGGWFRVWIGNPVEICAMACVCKAFKPFLFPVCQLCGKMWTYQCHFSHAHFMRMCRERVVQANTCFACHKAHPCLSPYPIVDGRPDRFGLRQMALWSKECLRCGLQYEDMLAHDSYVCRHPPARPVPDIETPPSWPSSATSSTDSEDSAYEDSEAWTFVGSPQTELWGLGLA